MPALLPAAAACPADDSLAKAASKLQSLKALRASTAAPRAMPQLPPATIAAAAPAPAPAAQPEPVAAPPPPQPSKSPQLPQAGAEGEGSQQRLRCACCGLECRLVMSTLLPVQMHLLLRFCPRPARLFGTPSIRCHHTCSGEDSGELAARAALQQRRKSLAPATGGRAQRYGEWFDGDDRDLERTLNVGAGVHACVWS